MLKTGMAQRTSSRSGTGSSVRATEPRPCTAHGEQRPTSKPRMISDRLTEHDAIDKAAGLTQHEFEPVLRVHEKRCEFIERSSAEYDAIYMHIPGRSRPVQTTRGEPLKHSRDGAACPNAEPTMEEILSVSTVGGHRNLEADLAASAASAASGGRSLYAQGATDRRSTNGRGTSTRPIHITLSNVTVTNRSTLNIFLPCNQLTARSVREDWQAAHTEGETVELREESGAEKKFQKCAGLVPGTRETSAPPTLKSGRKTETPVEWL